MSRIISFFCILSILVPCLLILTACKKGQDPVTPPAAPPTPPEEKAPELYLPAAGSFGEHSTENFSTFAYYEASTETLLTAFEIATERLKNSEATYDEALAAVDAVEQLYAEYMSMLSYAQIKFAENAADTYFSGEYKRLYAALPKVSFAMEKLFAAVAASSHGEALAKTDYFSDDIVERYQSGGIYTAETLPLFERENELMLALEEISFDTVTVTYNQMTDTVTNVLAFFESNFGKESSKYQQAHIYCTTLYNKEANKKRAEHYLSLLSVRREIADTLGYESYAQLATERLGYGASKTDTQAVLAAVEAYVLPVYQALSAADYFHTNTGKVEKIKFAEQTINTLTRFFEARGGKLFEGYNYLLRHSLFSFGNANDSRTEGTFTAYFYDRAQPFLFAGMKGTAADYIETAKAVGAALNAYQNNKADGAFSVAARAPEISDAFGLSLGLLTLQGMKAELSKTENTMEDSSYLVLLKSEMYNIFQLTLTQCMRTQIEWEAYALAKNEISEEALNEIIARAAERFGCFEMEDGATMALSLSTAGLLSADMLHKPMMTFSDVTSYFVAISLFVQECTASGSGFAAFEKLLATDISESSFADILAALSLKNPADPESAHTLVTMLYEILTGYAYPAEMRVSGTNGKA